MRSQALALAFVLVAAALLAGCSGARASTCDGVTRQSVAGNLSDPNHSVVAISTSKGCLVAELYDDKTPITVQNFKTYVEDKFYSDLLFHRIVKDFIFQGGGMQRNGQWKTGTHPGIENEAVSSGLKNLEYTLAMARSGEPNSATNQFFISTNNNPSLDPDPNSTDASVRAGYAVFGILVKGRDVADLIESVPVQAHQPGLKCQQDVRPSCPVSDVILHSAKVL